ncbi:APC family permease [Spiroplasma endosymbiont of Othius punctulatus]|uniref:APC family permease n=1 Tax=Spiroplasma endosymbiont of Othius punctulatus TaxID=3066289 RepID=UPI0030D16178
MKIKNKTKSNEIGLISGIWMVFSLIAGISFTLMFSDLYNPSDPSSFIGYHIIWIILLVSIFLFSSAWAYIKCSRIHNSANGGGGQYVRTAFGSFWGMFFNFVSLLCISIVVVIMVVSSLRMSLESIAKPVFGNWTKLMLDVFGLLACAIGATIAVLGIGKFKSVSTMIAYTTWAITLLILIFGIVLIFLPSDQKVPEELPTEVHSSITLKSFVNVFMLVMFSFTGFETFISTGSAIKNREKNMPIMILVGLTLTTLFFIAFSSIIIASVVNDFAGNPNANMFGKFNSVFIQKGGWFIVVACTFLNRFNTMTQLGFYGSNILEPLVKEGYISKEVFSSKEMKNNVNKKLILTFFILNIIFATIFLLLPDLIEGISGEPSLIGYGTLASVTSLIFAFCYILVILSAIKFGFKKQLKVNIFEYIIWSITIVVFASIGIYTIVEMFIDFANGIKTNDLQAWLSPLIQILFIIMTIVISLILFFVVKKKIMKNMSEQDLKEMEEYQSITFEILEDPKLRKTENKA